MRRSLQALCRIGLALVLALVVSAGPAFAQKTLQRDDLASEGVRLEERLRIEAGPFVGGKPAAQLRREAAGFLARGSARTALPLAMAAVVADPREAANWLALARTARAIEPRDWNERYRLQERATVAAYMAYQRARGAAAEAEALAALGDAFAWREIWRPALDAYRASLALADNPQLRRLYEDLREKRGFRILDYKVDSDSATPRVCFEFSEDLARGRVDFTPFIALSGAANAAVTAEGQQVCVDGLRHGERYAVVVRQGLPSAVGETLLRNADYEIYVRDRAPQVRFTGRNYVLPRTGQEGIPVVSVNTDRVEIAVMRVGERNLLPTLRSADFLTQLQRYSAEQIATEKGFKVWSGTLETRNETNRDVVTAFPVTEAVGTLEPGVYVMTARPPGAVSAEADDDYGPRATQWFVVSDLGVTAFTGPDGVHVLVRSLATARPLANAQVRLVARNNEVLASVATDATGHARFDAGLSRGTGGLAAGLVTVSLAGDHGFLDLSQGAFDLSDRGVKGRSAGGALEALVYPERGVYRSGETVFLTALLRDARGAAAAGLPVTLVVKRPDGVEFLRTSVADQGLGGRSLSVPLLSNSMRGTWRAEAFVDPKGPPVGEATFLVEDYVPERLDLVLTPKAERLMPGEAAEIDVAADFLFGAPGAGLDVSGEVVVQAAERTAIPGLDGFSVGLADESVEASTQEIEERGTTDARGRVTMRVPVQEVEAVRPIEARITLRVAESGGRAVERSLTLPILPSSPVLAVRKGFGGDLAEGATATFDVVAATPEGTRLARRGVTWTLSKLERRYQWFNSDGRWGFEPVTSTRRLADGTIDLSVQDPARIATPVQWGRYRLDVRVDGDEFAPVSVTFTVGWSGDQTADTPDLLDMTLDKAAYTAGETMRVRLAPRFAGVATLAVVSDRVHETLVVDVAAGGSDIAVPVKAEWGAGAYLVALAHRPLDVQAKRMPGRSLGLAWFGIDRERRSLSVALDTPAAMRPRGPLTIPVTLSGLSPGESARIVVAAVDVGILNLTRYQAPDPASFFFGQKQLSTEIRDLYGFLIDGMQGTRGAVRAGGDITAPSLQGTPPAQEPLARYSGIVEVGPDGRATVSFDIPAFNGTVRVMAVAWSAGRVGQASKDVVIRDPVVLAGTLPRFLNVGDESRLHVQIDNVEGPAGEYEFDVDLSGPVVAAADALRRTLRLEAGGKAALSVPITAAGPGLLSVDLRIRGQGVEAGQSYAMRTQPGTGALVRRIVRPLPAGGSVSVSSDLVADLVPGTASVSLSVSPLSALDVPGLLQKLDRYPYGCSEQIVSRALPLLYVDRLAPPRALALDDGVEERVRGAIARVLARQGSNGAFGLWSAGGGDDIWLDAYVTDFLTRARERGYAVPQGAFAMALDRLRNHVANTTQVEGAGNGLAYAAYVLARNGRPVMGDLRYLADTKIQDFATPLARGQIGAALALLGDRGRSQAAFAAAVELLRETRDSGFSRADYGSRLRDGAGLLALASETNLNADLVRPIAAVVGEERLPRRFTSTQEDAWMVLAAQATLRQTQAISLAVDGTPHSGPLFRTVRDASLESAPLRVENRGGEALQLVLSVAGNPLAPEPAESAGYTVERAYYKLDGSKVDPSSVRQNERLVAVLTVTEKEARFARLLVVDRLPAGFEIDNPKLVDSGSVGALGWLKTDVQPVHAEYRDDRFVAALDRDSGQPAFFTLAYMVRAVAPGRYVHPPALVEDMYRPERFGRTAFGTVEVTGGP